MFRYFVGCMIKKLSCPIPFTIAFSFGTLLDGSMIKKYHVCRIPYTICPQTNVSIDEDPSSDNQVFVQIRVDEAVFTKKTMSKMIY